MYNAILTNTVGATMDQPVGAMPHVRAGKVRFAAALTRERHPNHPSVPTMAEGGVPGLEMTFWFGLVAPRGTHAEIIARLNAEARQALATKMLRDRLANFGTDAVPSTPEQFAALIISDATKWSRAVKTSGAKIEQPG